MKRKIKVVLLALLSLVVLAAAGAAYYIHFVPHDTGLLRLQMAGDREIILPFGQDYEDSGATAVYTTPKGEDVQVLVSTVGLVDTQQLGDYTIKYLATYGERIVTGYRTVHVVDAAAPQITLTTVEGSYTLPGQPYQEEGYQATDDHDGDITDRVIRVEKDGVVTYTVKDAAGNSTSVQRQIRYFDPVLPVLKLNGSQYVTIRVDTEYKEPGFAATDNCDGDLTEEVTVTGSVDVHTPGAYVLQYTVQDAFGNQASCQRTVCVLPKSDEELKAPNGKVIYLTFDDGPGPDTGRLLDVLKKYEVKATFFVVNTGYISTVARAAQEGHSIAIHTASHVYSQIYANEEAYFQDLHTMQDIIEQHTGTKSMLMRFPGGSSNAISASYNRGIMTRLVQQVTEQGFYYFDWNVDSKDAWNAKTAEQVFQNVVAGIGSKQQSVVLQHDIHGYSVDAVERIIIWGLTNGYTFAALDKDSPGCHHGINN